jgi:hypothetical protein
MKETVFIEVEESKVRICEICSREYIAQRKDSKTCGCTRPKLEDRICEECGSEFQPKTQKSKYCTRKCGKKAHNDRTKEANRVRSQKWYSENKERASIRRKKHYWKDPEKWRTKTREYIKLHKEQVRKTDNEYKDKTRHDGKRAELIEEHGYKCSKCGENKKPFDIVAHHVTFDAQNHKRQVLLCRSCHAKIHREWESFFNSPKNPPDIPSY